MSCMRLNTVLLFMYTDAFNYALFRPANQSTTYMDNMAGNAVDGTDATLSRTESYDFWPWWKVQLSNPILVTHVGISNAHGWGKHIHWAM